MATGRILKIRQLLAFGLVTWLLAVLSSLFTNFVSSPYMDEIFHVPQAQAFCGGRTDEWDDKITTPPGPYWCASVVYWLLSSFVDISCSLQFLRSINILFAAGQFWIIYDLLADKYSPHSTRHLLKSFEVFLFPVQFFFHFLYYTDSGSTFWVLLMYWFAKNQRLAWSAVAGGTAVLFRQTNIIWMVFVAGTVVVSEFEHGQQNSQHQRSAQPFFVKVKDFVVYCITNFVGILKSLFLFVVAVVLFFYFVWKNGGIVLGDKSNHIAIFHAPQILYFILFSALFLGTRIIFPSHIIRFIQTFWLEIFPKKVTKSPNHKVNFRMLMYYFVTSFVLAALIHKFTYAHPFLLADNRHYTFYIWKNIFRRFEYAKYALVPIYIVGFRCLGFIFDDSCSELWQFVFWICTCATLIPTPLLEFRYYIIPFLLIQLHSRDSLNEVLLQHQSKLSGQQIKAKKESGGGWILFCNVFGNAVLNGLVIWTFLLKDFRWSDGSVARFMW